MYIASRMNPIPYVKTHWARVLQGVRAVSTIEHITSASSRTAWM
jgi:hypothetical protein